jgi:hypothetical protein
MRTRLLGFVAMVEHEHTLREEEPEKARAD